MTTRWRGRWRHLVQLHDELFMAPWRAGIAREARAQSELLLTLVFLEALGVENPAAFAGLELYPDLVEGYHDWHRRAGMDTAPEPGVCC